MTSKRSSPDFILMGIVIAILMIGLWTVYSASNVSAEYKFQDSFYFVKRQSLFAVVGLAAMLFLMRIDYWVWREKAKFIWIISLLLLILVLIPGIGMERNGSRSWIGIGVFSIQPSEFMKLAMVAFLSQKISENHRQFSSFKKGLLPVLFFILFAFGMIMLQPDLGTGAVLLGSSLTLLFVGGTSIRYFVMMFFLGIVGFTGLILSAPYRLKRILSFMDPWSDPLVTGFQMIQSLYAIGPGGLLGMGIGASKQKHFYLPEPQTDFIYSIFSEELGFIGAAFLLVLFFALLIRGIQTAIHAPDLFGTLLATGIISTITIQVVINISVVIGLMPVTGITLPFMSYGGSSLTILLSSVGILLNISRWRTRE